MSWEDKVSNLLGHCTRSAAFGEDVIHYPSGGGSQTISGIWSDSYLSVDPADGAQIMSDDPNVGARISDFDTAPRKGDIIERRGVRYIVRAPEKDGEGGITLVLEREV